MLKLSTNQQFILVSFFLLTLVIILNLSIPTHYKLILVLLGVILCYYQPKFIVPFLTSIMLVFLSNKKLCKSPKSQTIERFVDGDIKDEFLKKMEGITDSNYLSKISTDDITNLKSKKIDITDVDKNTLLKTRFLKDIFQVYFFDYPTNYAIALDFNMKYKNLSTLQDQFNFVDISFETGVGDDPYRNNSVADLQDRPLLKLGLFVYQTKFLNIQNYFTRILTQLGLLSLVNGNFQLDNPELTSNDLLEQTRKKCYEISILLFFLTYKEEDSGKNNFNFNEPINLMDLSLYDILPQLVKDQNKKAEDSYFLKLPTLLDEINVTLNKFTLDTIKLKFFPSNEIIKKYIEGNVELNISNLDENTNLDTLTQNIENLMEEIEEHFNEIKIIDIKNYRFANLTQRRAAEFKIKNNYFLLLLASGYFDELIELLVKTNKEGGTEELTDIYKNLLDLYQQKKNKFSLQIQNEITIGEEGKFTNIQDKYLDNFFFYLGLKSNESKTFPRILNYVEPQLPPSPEMSASPVKPNEIVDYQQNLYELELDKLIDPAKVKEKQEEALNKYYQFLDKENFEKVQGLGKLAEERNKELKIKELSLHSVIDNFGGEVFSMIDELLFVFKNFYQDKDLSGFTGKIKEGFNPFLSPNPTDKTKLDKYITLVKSILNILLQENRILYTGFIFIVLAMLLYFIDSSSSTTPDTNSAGIKSIFDLLKL